MDAVSGSRPTKGKLMAGPFGLNTGRRETAGRHPTASSAQAAVTVDAAYSDFFRQEFLRVVRTVYLLVGDHGRAEEVAQDAFLELLRRWPAVSKYEKPDAWVRRVAIRMAGRQAGRERMRRFVENRFQARSPAPPPESGQDVQRAVQSLPPGQRAAVVLFYFEDRPVAEIADILGCAPATARAHLHKARRRLAAILREEVDDAI
jgi:RNA polymerase sigma factor (sigma-70 family)